MSNQNEANTNYKIKIHQHLSRQEALIVPLQAATLHSRVSVEFPLHCSPPYASLCFIPLVLDCTPPPHERLQSPQCPNSSQVQFPKIVDSMSL